jgi:hypothetical protein
MNSGSTGEFVLKRDFMSTISLTSFDEVVSLTDAYSWTFSFVYYFLYFHMMMEAEPASETLCVF